MRYIAIGLAVLVGCSTTDRTAIETSRRNVTRAAVVARDSDKLSNLHHPVSTTSAEAQRHFDDGLTLIYAFNHDEGVRSFEKALKADPKLAMAHWGIALALGPNYNLDVDAEREKKAYEHIQTAR